MVNIKYVDVLMSMAFINWMQSIGYLVVKRTFTIEFIPTYHSKALPRGGSIDLRGHMNKVARKLFIEFKGHVES